VVCVSSVRVCICYIWYVSFRFFVAIILPHSFALCAKRLSPKFSVCVCVCVCLMMSKYTLEHHIITRGRIRERERGLTTNGTAIFASPKPALSPTKLPAEGDARWILGVCMPAVADTSDEF
jgi:hypothetical protein